ncbi:hypothetical protein BC830DRAFT_1166498 [Chytriomyces sp. MP71]|nr:hypothetical protein BC830DRAFT_1166498 [Chytriomyces sp. MP71]
MLDVDYHRSWEIATTFYSFASLVALYGIMAAVQRLGRTSESSRFMSAIIFCNTMLLLEVIGFEWGNVAVGRIPCLYGGIWQNAAYHLCVLTFDGFLLYKAWIISSENKQVALSASFLLLVRFAFGLADTTVSRGYIDDTGNCLWFQFNTALYGYMVTDIIVDLVATVVIVTCCWKIDDTVELSHVLMVENVTRSVVSLVQAILYIIASQNQNVFTFANGIQMLIIAILLNAEFWWTAARSAAYALYLRRKAAIEELQNKRSQVFVLLTKREDVPNEEQSGPKALDAVGSVDKEALDKHTTKIAIPMSSIGSKKSSADTVYYQHNNDHIWNRKWSNSKGNVQFRPSQTSQTSQGFSPRSSLTSLEVTSTDSLNASTSVMSRAKSIFGF